MNNQSVSQGTRPGVFLLPLGHTAVCVSGKSRAGFPCPLPDTEVHKDLGQMTHVHKIISGLRVLN